MKLIFACCFFLLVSNYSYANYPYGNEDSDYNNQNKNSSETSTKDSSTTKNDGGNNKLVEEMNKKTEIGLKVFDKILGKDGDQAKQDFAQNIGQDPTSGELGGDGSGEDDVKNPFGEAFGGDSKTIDQRGG